MPMGQMPCLEVDGRRVHQSLAMCRYVAKQVGVSGKDAFEDLQIDAIVDTINEFRLSKLSIEITQSSLSLMTTFNYRNRNRIL